MMLLSPVLNGYLASLSPYSCSPAEMPCVQEGCRTSRLGQPGPWSRAPGSSSHFGCGAGDLYEEEWMAEAFPLPRRSAYPALLTSERPYWSPRISSEKHMENLGLGYLAHCQLSLCAEMKEMRRTAPSLSSGGGKPAAASWLAVLPFPCHFM